MGKKIDLTGQKFGKLTVIRDTSTRKGSEVVWECECECGEVRYASISQLKYGQIKACRVCAKRTQGKRSKDELVGLVFGELTVLSQSSERYYKAVLWECVCSCGAHTKVTTACLKAELVKTCGMCLQSRRDEQLLGKSFGKWAVIRSSTSNGRKYECICECGTLREVWGYLLLNGKSTSCGCSRREPTIENTASENTGIVKKRRQRNIPPSLWKDVRRYFHNNTLPGAKSRELPVEIDVDYLVSIFTGYCGKTGVKITFRTSCKDSHENQTASLDRIDSSKGYIVGNVRWVHKVINFAKQDTSDSEYVGWCTLVTNFARSNTMYAYF